MIRSAQWVPQGYKRSKDWSDGRIPVKKGEMIGKRKESALSETKGGFGRSVFAGCRVRLQEEKVERV